MTLSHDSTMRKICNEFFDALESGDIGKVSAFYAEDMTMWVNTTGQEMTREENLKALEDGKALHRRRLYNDRRINAVHDGFVVQYTCEVTTHKGDKFPLNSCLVAQVWGDKIVKLYEYMDMGAVTRAAKANA
jgi:ketosteroid isomerase-like protein